ncbi:hypothetical protein ACFQH8_19195 [Halomicroarcula sp. GCM10025710]
MLSQRHEVISTRSRLRQFDLDRVPFLPEIRNPLVDIRDLERFRQQRRQVVAVPNRLPNRIVLTEKREEIRDEPVVLVFQDRIPVSRDRPAGPVEAYLVALAVDVDSDVPFVFSLGERGLRPEGCLDGANKTDFPCQLDAFTVLTPDSTVAIPSEIPAIFSISMVQFITRVFYNLTYEFNDWNRKR